MRHILTIALLLAAAPASAETLIVGNKGENTVSFIDLASGKELARSASGANPHEVALSPDGTRAAVVNYGGSAIDVYAVPGGERLATWDISPNARPHGLLWLGDGRLVATAEGSKTLVVIDGADGRVVRSIPTGAEGSHMVAVHPSRPRAYTANMKSGSASVVDLESGRTIGHLAAGREAEGIALTPDGKQLWISSRGSNEVHVYDTETEKLVRRIEAGPFPLRIAISPDGKEAVTSNLEAGTLGVYSVATGRLERTVPVSGTADAMQVTILFRPDGKRLYVAETGRNMVAELEWPGGKVLRRIPVGVNGDGLGWSPVGAE
ncbi:YncE family protein [Sphingosinicella microcystinivorans]|uniref:YncE family protein n=1 Tax=Sphingosinicella microcystinivorans TaxID=335406 RepID=UPI0022F3B827|nr:beta-propeller fold lactonase family protein [Sphingosinicella microcystinivorans]WBX83084.1 beta-propeller fold lactonase family protein [Sphingosinicella microcystinivorans]